MALESDAQDKINKRVYRDYPEMNGTKPTVSAEGDRYTLTYRGKVSTPAGPLSRIVRVVADASGKVLRMSTSK